MTAPTSCYTIGAIAFAAACFAGPDPLLRFTMLLISHIWFAAGFVVNTRKKP